ncbi:MAG: YbfB/YjiJ family MFS transporter [Halioglobus sp.]
MKNNQPSPAYATISGFCLFAISICLARFAYGPLVPSLIDMHWVTKAEAGYLGAFNGLGYIVGCVVALWLPRITGIRLLMRTSLLLAVIGLGMCFWNFGFIWLAVGRSLAGFAAAALMVHTTALVVRSVSAKAKSMCLGFAVSGGGIAIVVISLVLPFFIVKGPSGGWFVEAAITFFIAAVAWRFVSMAPHEREPSPDSIKPLTSRRRRLVLLITAAYTLMSVAVVPHTLFLADYMHRDLGLSVGDSSSLFSILGVGCAVGAIYVGPLTRLVNTRWGLSINYMMATAAIAMVLLFDSVIVVAGSAFLIGVSLFGVVALSSIRTLEIVGLSRHAHFWGGMALGFGAGMAGGSYAMSALLSRGFHYIDLFQIAQVTVICALVILLFARWRYRDLENFTGKDNDQATHLTV